MQDAAFFQSQHNDMSTITSPTSTATPDGVIGPNSPAFDTMPCMWGDCRMRFRDQETLLQHIQNAHLLAPSHATHRLDAMDTTAAPQPDGYNISFQSMPQYHHEPSPSKTVPCLWGDCSTHINMPIPVDHQQCSDCYNPYGDLSKLDTDSLIQHLLADHFKQQIGSPQSFSEYPMSFDDAFLPCSRS